MDSTNLLWAALALIAGVIAGGAALMLVTRKQQRAQRESFETKLVSEVEGLRKSHGQAMRRMEQARSSAAKAAEEERAALQHKVDALTAELDDARVALTELLSAQRTEAARRRAPVLDFEATMPMNKPFTVRS